LRCGRAGGETRVEEMPVDLATAVAASMLPGSRTAVAAAFQQCRLAAADGPDLLARMLSALGFPEPMHAEILEAARAAAVAALASANHAGVEALTVASPQYPVLLGCTADPPAVLWVRGDGSALERPAVAVIGSRAASGYALQVGSRLAGELAECGVVVVSGLARGVDSAAHRGCLQAGGATVAVLGSGLDRIYPPEHEPLAATIERSGALVSELPLGTPPLPEHFPLRNRIISGISLAVVVVEASEKSGSLITARCALEQGRDVMAVPGSILSGRNRGSHSLLKDGAKIVESADDILQELGWPQAPGGPPRRDLPEDPLLVRMDRGERYGLDQLVDRCGVPAARLLSRLTELELQGRITSSSGKFMRP
jgi:DNA processing protein